MGAGGNEMRRRVVISFAVLSAAAAIVFAVATAAVARDNPTIEGSILSLYEADLTAAQSAQLRGLDFDIVGQTGDGKTQIVATQGQASAIERLGIELTQAIRSSQRQAEEFDVWRPYSGVGGFQEEIETLAAENPDLLKLVEIGRSVRNQPILALKMTKDANEIADGSRPATLSMSLQHAREWIVGETNRRILLHLLNGYGVDQEVTDLVDTTEIWFILVHNPDGYDLTFEGERLWRKNVRDNDSNAVIDGLDGVDLNRNAAFRWGYDNEGSSPDLTSAVYRGPGPESEPESVALEALMSRIDFSFLLNWHSAAELILYGNGWQVSTDSPDDHISIALAGNDVNPAVPGYDPDQGAELYITNGTTSGHAHSVHGIVGFTPELDTCEAAEDLAAQIALEDPEGFEDVYGDSYCEDESRSVFEFPDDERLIEEVFLKNLDYAMSVFKSAPDPANPVTSTGIDAEDFYIDTFDKAHGTSQIVSTDAKRQLEPIELRYSINGGPILGAPATAYDGGERYGDKINVHYAEYRATVPGTVTGDMVTVYFVSQNSASDAFTYEVIDGSDADVLIIANEDYDGFNPVQEGVDAPLYTGLYAAALTASGYTSNVWDVTADGSPDHLGVLSGYDAIIWEYGENLFTQEEEDVLTDTPFGELPDLQVAEVQQYLTVSVRDYLNDGGKLLAAGDNLGYFGFFASGLGGAYYGLNGDETADCVVTESFFADCLIYSDDFSQYWQGISLRSDSEGPIGATGVASPLEGAVIELDPNEVPFAGQFLPTGEVLGEGFPQFDSASVAEYQVDGVAPTEPFTGENYANALHADSAWMRLAKTIDLTDEPASASLAFQISANIEDGYDHVIVEARPEGGSWTTLPEVDGLTSQLPPTECEAGFFIDLHPDLANYLTVVPPGEELPGTCEPTGVTGDWHSIGASTDGWTPATYDLTDYVGDRVDVAITYVTDPAFGGLGVFVDDVQVVSVDGDSVAVDATSFEDGSGGWTAVGPPATSPGNFRDWVFGPSTLPRPAGIVTTEDTVTMGFGFEAITTAGGRADAMAAFMDHLGLAQEPTPTPTPVPPTPTPTPVPPTPTPTPVPPAPGIEPGFYVLRNADTGRYLDGDGADSGYQVDTSVEPAADDRWEVIDIGDGDYLLRNAVTGRYLDADGADNNFDVNQSENPSLDDQWAITPAGNEGEADTYYLINAEFGRYLDADGEDNGFNAETSAAPSLDDEWELIASDGPPPPEGNFATVQNVSTGRYLDADGADEGFNVESSGAVGDDDIWELIELENGNYLFRNVVYDRYLDADDAGNNFNVDLSVAPAADDEWEIIDREDGTVYLRNAERNRYLDIDADTNVDTSVNPGDDDVWRIIAFEVAD